MLSFVMVGRSEQPLGALGKDQRVRCFAGKAASIQICARGQDLAKGISRTQPYRNGCASIATSVSERV
jgi:hypothetical protein